LTKIGVRDSYRRLLQLPVLTCISAGAMQIVNDVDMIMHKCSREHNFF